MPLKAYFPQRIWDGSSATRQSVPGEPVLELLDAPDGYDWQSIVAEVIAVETNVANPGNTFNVLSYGAIADGETDNSAAFAAVADAVNANPQSLPQLVIFPPGIYDYASGLDFTTPVILTGTNASILNYTGIGAAITLGPSGLTSSTYHKLYIIQGLTLVGGSSMTYGIYVNNFVTMPHILDVYFLNFGNADAAAIYYAGDNWDAYCEHCEFFSNSSTVLNWIWVGQEDVDSTRLRVNNCLGSCVGSGHGYGIRVNGVANQITNCKIEGFDPAIIVGPLADSCEISSSYFESANSNNLIQYGQEPDNETNLSNYITNLRIVDCYANLHYPDDGYTGSLLGPRNTYTGLQGLVLRDNAIDGLCSTSYLVSLNTGNSSQSGTATDNQGSITLYSPKYQTGTDNLFNFWGMNTITDLSITANDTQGAYVNVNAAQNVVGGSGGSTAIRFFDAGTLSFQFVATLGNGAGYRYGGFQANTDRDGNKLPLWFFTQDADGDLQVGLQISCGQTAGYGGILSGNGSGLTSLNASYLSSGTVPVSRLPTFVASGSGHAAGAVPDPGSTEGTTRYLREDATWDTPSSGSGSVTSVGVSTSGVLYTVADTPVTSSGTIQFELITQSANTLLAGPTASPSATPTFRTLVDGDLSTTHAALTDSSNTFVAAQTIEADSGLTIESYTANGGAGQLSLIPQNSSGSSSGGAAEVNFYDGSSTLGGRFLGAFGNGSGFRYIGFQAMQDRNSNYLPLWFFTTDAGGSLQLALEIAGGQTSGTVGTITLNGNVSVANQVNFVFSTSTGTKFGTSTSQKLGFFNTTPVAQQAGGSKTAQNWYTGNEQSMINAMWTALRNLGLLS